MPFSDRIAQDISELIGATPMVKLNRLVEQDAAQILAKLENFNPGGSVKDRICLSMIEDAEKNNRPVEYRKLFDFSDMKQSKQIDELSKYTYKNADIIEESNVCACYFCLKTFPSHLVIDFVDKGKTALCPVCKTESVYGDASGFSMHPKFVALAGKWYFDGSSETF